VRVTNEGKEMDDEEMEKFNKEYMNLGPQWQIPNPEDGPLEKRVQTTFVDGLMSGEISPEETEYWFTEPQGQHLQQGHGLSACSLCGLVPLYSHDVKHSDAVCSRPLCSSCEALRGCLLQAVGIRKTRS